MILSDTAIRRPVFTTMVIAIIMVFGAISFREIGLDLFPRVEFPIITILSVLPGADPETVETSVSDPIEEVVSTISSIKNLRSTSTEGISQVVIEFELEKNIDVAYQEVQAKLGTIRSQLPLDMEPSVVEKFDLDSAPVIALVLSGNLPIQNLTHLADKTVKERLQRVRNVGQVKLIGGRKRNIWLWLDRAKLEGYHLSIQDVVEALRIEHVEYPGGRIEAGRLEYVVKTKAEFTSAQEFGGLIVAYRAGTMIQVRDVGRVEDGLEEERSMASLNGIRAISLLVRRQSGTNTVAVANAVKTEIDKLRIELAPQGIRLEIAQDLSTFILNSVHEVQFHIIYGGGLAIVIVFLFLRNVRSTIICALVLPTSIVGTFWLMKSLQFTQNIITLMALSLAIGLLIDDSIVVQENTMRHVEEGKPPREAAAFATNEIALAVLATTFSVVAVFVPVAFMRGLIGRFFYQFGLTVTFAVLISLFVSFTLDPMLSSRLLSKPKKGWAYRLSEYPFLLLERWYERLLAISLRWRFTVVLLALIVFVFSGYMASYLRSEFIPLEDQSEFSVKVRAPLGSSLKTTEAILERIRLRLAGQPWLDYAFTTIGSGELQRVNEGSMYVKMLPKGQRAMSQRDAMQWTRAIVANIQEAKVSVNIIPRVSGGGMKSGEVQLEIRGKELPRLEEITAFTIAYMHQAGSYVDMDTNYEKGKPEANVYVNRNRAADMGVSPWAIATTIKTMIGGDDIAKFRAQGERYDVSVRLMEKYRRNPEDISLLTVRNRHGKLIRLDNVAKVVPEMGPVEINRYNRTRQITIYANLNREKKVLGQAIAEMTNFLNSQGLPSGYGFGFVGEAEMMQDSFANLLFALQLGIVIVYMVLASQFESFLHPFTIMLSVPLSVIGAFGALIITGLTVSMFTLIGIIMLMGLVTKNGILLVDFANTLRERDHLERTTAIIKAGTVRLRPILMTTLAMIFGMLPIALGKGSGSETRAPMAVTVIGGLIASTLLTLVVVPAVYSIVDDLRHPSQWRIWKR